MVGTITQNVDRLHHAAGSRKVVELHGALHQVRCIECGRMESRDGVQERLLALNPGFDRLEIGAAPDGDAELPDALVEGFRVAGCQRCDGLIKPDVVFFGETVPRVTVEAATALVERAEALLVAGSSLMVLSGLRYVRLAARRGVPIAIVNLGPTRGDALATTHLDADVTDVLPLLGDALG